MIHLHLNKRTFLLFFLLLTVSGAIWAAPRTVEQAKQAAQEQMLKYAVKRVKSLDGKSALEPQLVFTQPRKNAPASDAYYYVFSAGADCGYTIISGDDRFPAVVGYTQSGDYDVEKLPVNLVSFMQSYQDFMDTATDAQIAEIQAWKALPAIHTAVEPFVESKWNQYAPYNNQCPTYFGTERAVTGCVATAIAQILYYHRWPNELKADIEPYTTGSYRISMGGIKQGEVYDWNNMLPVYDGGETNAQANAVAKLMLHAGCAVKMNYGPSSGANASAETFTKYFGMDKELTRLLSRSNYTIPEWDNMLYEEMAAKRPVYYDGQSTGGGHAFVIHGYRDGLYFVNWGWGGLCDGYFDITILNPNNTSGAGASSSEDGYSQRNGMIIGIQPDNGRVDEMVTPTVAAYKKLELDGATATNGRVSGQIKMSPENNCLEGTIYVGVGYMDSNGKIVNVVNSPFIMDSKICPPNYFYEDIQRSCSFQYEEGKTYKLMLIESEDLENWIACQGAANTAVTIKIENGNVLIIEEIANLSAVVGLDKEHSGGYAGMDNSIDVTVTNAGNAEYYDIVHVRVGTSEEMPNNNVYATGITAPVDGSTTFNFAYAPQKAGTYYFWVLDANENVIGQSSIEFKTPVAPQLSVVSIITDNASDDKVYVDYKDYKMEVNKVYDKEADFIVEIKNDGGYYEGNYWIYYYNESAGNFSGYREKLVFPEKQTIQFRFTKAGNVGSTAGVWIESDGTSAELEPLEISFPFEKNGGKGKLSFKNIFFCYLAGYNTDEALTVTGTLDEGNVKALNNKLAHNDVITTLDLSGATLNTQTEIKTDNPNTLIYLGENGSVGNKSNVVKNGVCDNLALTDGHPFRAAQSFTATDATYSRTLNGEEGWYSVCLPYAATISDDVVVEKFESVDASAQTVTFAPVAGTMEAYTPYIFRATDGVAFSGNGVKVDVTPSQIADGSFIGTFSGIAAPGLAGYYVLNADGSGFALASDKAYARPFRAVIHPDGLSHISALRLIHAEGDETGVTGVQLNAEEGDEYYNLQGVRVQHPSKGIYVKNGKKVIIK